MYSRNKFLYDYGTFKRERQCHQITRRLGTLSDYYNGQMSIGENIEKSKVFSGRETNGPFIICLQVTIYNTQIYTQT